MNTTVTALAALVRASGHQDITVAYTPVAEVGEGATVTMLTEALNAPENFFAATRWRVGVVPGGLRCRRPSTLEQYVQSVKFREALSAPMLSRVDVLYGWGTVTPELATRITDVDAKS